MGSFVLGDSISLSVAADLSRLGYPVTGQVGATASVSFLQEHLRSAAAQAAPAWVIILGTNNRGDENDLAQVDEWLRTIRQERSGRPRQQVYWVTPHRPEDYRGGMSTHTLDALTAALVAEAERRPWLHVLDWAAAAKANPQWYELDGSRLHPDENGQQAIVDLIAGAAPMTAATPAPIVTIAPPSPKATPGPDPAGGEEFTDMEFTNE